MSNGIQVSSLTDSEKFSEIQHQDSFQTAEFAADPRNDEPTNAVRNKRNCFSSESENGNCLSSRLSYLRIEAPSKGTNETPEQTCKDHQMKNYEDISFFGLGTRATNILSDQKCGNDEEQVFCENIHFLKVSPLVEVSKDDQQSTLEDSSQHKRLSLISQTDLDFKKFYGNGIIGVNDKSFLLETGESRKEIKLRESHFNIQEDYESVPPEEILISFDTPRRDDIPRISAFKYRPPFPPKLYTEEEMQKAVKNQELISEGKYLKKQQEMEKQVMETELKLISDLSQITKVCSAWRELLFEVLMLTSELKKRNQELVHENIRLELKCKSLKELHKEEIPYLGNIYDFDERAKNMIKERQKNEENLRTALRKQEKIYEVLHLETSEAKDKGNLEIMNKRKASNN